MKCFSIKTSLQSFACGLIEMWKLLEMIFVNPATLKNILTKLYDCNDVFSSNFLWRLAHFVQLTKHHCLCKHDINVRWNSSKNCIKIFGNTWVCFVFICKHIIHVSHKKNYRFHLQSMSSIILLLLWKHSLNFISLFKFVQNLEFSVISNAHLGKFRAVSENNWDVFALYVFIY